MIIKSLFMIKIEYLIISDLGIRIELNKLKDTIEQ